MKPIMYLLEVSGRIVIAITLTYVLVGAFKEGILIWLTTIFLSIWAFNPLVEMREEK